MGAHKPTPGNKLNTTSQLVILLPMLWWILASLLLLAVIGLLWLFWWPGWQRRRVMTRAFPAPWQQILHDNLPYYARLPENLRQRLQQRILWFLHEKTFVACGGLQLSDEMRITIAAEACLLTLHQTGNDYARLRFIYLYPSAYKAANREVTAAGVVSEHTQHRLGESWHDGKVVLSWDDVSRGSSNFGDGENVVLHEFAHQLDQASGDSNGAPLLRSAQSYQQWAKVLAHEFEALQQDARHGHRSTMKHYGATNPAEFFAVATEHFYEQPEAMQQQHPQLFQQLQTYYGLDPRVLH